MFILKCDICGKHQTNTDPVWCTHTGRTPFRIVYDLCPNCRDKFDDSELDTHIESKLLTQDAIYGRRSVSREAYMEVYWSKVLCSGQAPSPHVDSFEYWKYQLRN